MTSSHNAYSTKVLDFMTDSVSLSPVWFSRPDGIESLILHAILLVANDLDYDIFSFL